MKALNIFISYAHEDHAIAFAVSNMLQRTFGESLGEVFLDYEGIGLGANIKNTIMSAIKRADVMIVVSTGVGRQSHEWTGWELGAFEATHEKKCDDNGIIGSVVTICLENTLPSTVQAMRFVPLGIKPSWLEKSEAEFAEKVEITREDEFIMLLGDIHQATEGTPLDERRDLLDQFKKQVKAFKTLVFAQLKKMIRVIRKPQHQLVIRYDGSRLEADRQDLPSDATITEIGNTFSLFGISAEDTTRFRKDPEESLRLPTGIAGTTIAWSDFRAAVAKHTLGEYWCASITRVIVSAGIQTLDVDNRQVITSHDQENPRRFRVILTTSTTFYNKTVEASLYLVEALQSRDYGNESTTLLLKGLHIVCRFRFLFLEEESAYNDFSVAQSKIDGLPAIASQLISELDLLRTEAMQANLHKPGAWRKYVSRELLEAMSASWYPIETHIRSLCCQILKTTNEEDQQRDLQTRLVVELKKIDATLKAPNSRLIQAMASKLSALAEPSEP